MRPAITTGIGHVLAIDDAKDDRTPRPDELLLAAEGGCAAVDVTGGGASDQAIPMAAIASNA